MENSDLNAIELVILETGEHFLLMWRAIEQVCFNKTHIHTCVLSVRHPISINYWSIFTNSSKTSPKILKNIYWNTEAVLMSGGLIIHLVLMLPLIFKSFVHHSFGSKNNWVVFMTASLPWFSYIKTLFFSFSNSFIHCATPQGKSQAVFFYSTTN